MNGAVFAVLAVIPMITGPLPEEAKAITAQLCGGGEITIPLRDQDPEPGRKCNSMACHAATAREKQKRSN